MRIRLLAVAGLLFLAACGERNTAPTIFPVPPQMTLYSIREDRDINNVWAEKAEKLEDFPTLGKVKITDPQVRQEVIEALDLSVASAKGMAACFNPRHGIRAIDGASQTDYIICFECCSMHILVAGKRKAYAIDGSAQEFLNKLLREANAPLNPSR